MPMGPGWGTAGTTQALATVVLPAIMVPPALLRTPAFAVTAIQLRIIPVYTTVLQRVATVVIRVIIGTRAELLIWVNVVTAMLILTDTSLMITAGPRVVLLIPLVVQGKKSILKVTLPATGPVPTAQLVRLARLTTPLVAIPVLVVTTPVGRLIHPVHPAGMVRQRRPLIPPAPAPWRLEPSIVCPVE